MRLLCLLLGAGALALGYGAYRMVHGGTTWREGEAYDRGALVRRGGSYYRALDANYDADPLSQDGRTKWRPGKLPLPYDPGRLYHVGEEVDYEGMSFRFERVRPPGESAVRTADVASILPTAQDPHNPWRRLCTLRRL